MTDPRLPAPIESALDRLALLQEPVRRRVFAHVANSAGTTRDETAAAVGIDRPLAAFHLERLLDAGLVDADFAAAPSAPSAVGEAAMRKRAPGRPAKRYHARDLGIDLSLPSRD